jgi:hypothetical protein
MNPESDRLEEARTKNVPWRKWGPYLSERQWGTVREDYSDSGDAWNYFSHDQARSRAYRWGEDGQRRLVAVNYSGNQAQCYVRLPYPDRAGRSVRLQDLLSAARYDRDGHELASRGLYLDLPAWGHHAFEVTSR